MSNKKAKLKTYKKGRAELDKKPQDIIYMAKEALSHYNIPILDYDDVLGNVLFNVYNFTYKTKYAISTYVRLVTRTTVSNFYGSLYFRTRHEGGRTVSVDDTNINEVDDFEGQLSQIRTNCVDETDKTILSSNTLDINIFNEWVEDCCDTLGSDKLELWLDYVLTEGSIDKIYKSKYMMTSHEKIKAVVDEVETYLNDNLYRYTDIGTDNVKGV